MGGPRPPGRGWNGSRGSRGRALFSKGFFCISKGPSMQNLAVTSIGVCSFVMAKRKLPPSNLGCRSPIRGTQLLQLGSWRGLDSPALRRPPPPSQVLSPQAHRGVRCSRFSPNTRNLQAPDNQLRTEDTYNTILTRNSPRKVATRPPIFVASYRLTLEKPSLGNGSVDPCNDTGCTILYVGRQVACFLKVSIRTVTKLAFKSASTPTTSNILIDYFSGPLFFSAPTCLFSILTCLVEQDYVAYLKWRVHGPGLAFRN